MRVARFAGMASSSFQGARIGSNTLYAAVFLSSLPVVIGCSAGATSNQARETVKQTIQPIIRGRASGAEHDAVVILTTFRDGLRRSLCTATLVAPNLLITARHCVSDTDSTTACSKEGTPITGGRVKAERDPKDLVVFLGNNGIAPDTEVEANGSARGARVIVDSTTTVCNHDIAFLVLDKKLSAAITSIRLGPPAIDEKVAAVGWGVDETGTLPKSREVRSDIALIGVGPAMYPNSATYGYGDREFMLGESACSGDSGGPALTKSGAVVGVAARAGNGKTRDPSNYASTCVGETAHAVYTHLSSTEGLVTRAFQAAGAAIWLEGQPAPQAPKPEAVPTGEPAPASPARTADREVPTDPIDGETAAEAGPGCSIIPEPHSGAVGPAAGLGVLLASLVGLRRRSRPDRRGGPLPGRE
jgi:hypothetical protein